MQASTTTKPPTPPDAVPLEQKAVAITSAQLPAKITTPEQRLLLADELKGVTGWLKEWSALHDPVIASAYATHQLALKAKAKYAGPAETRKKAIAQLIGSYDVEQRQLAQKRADEQRRVQEAADRERRENEIREAQDRQREADNERIRLEEEAAAARQLASETDDLNDQAELLDVAESADREATDRGMEAGYERQVVEAIVAQPVVPAFVEVEDTVPQVEGVASRTTWFAEVVDKRRAVAAVLFGQDACDEILEQFPKSAVHWKRNEAMLDIVMPAFNRMATNAKKEIEIWPGVFARPKYGASAKA